MHENVATEIVGLAEKPQVVDVGGIPYLLKPDGWTAVDGRTPESAAPTLELATVSGLGDYLQHNRDGFERTTLTAHVVSPQRIHVWRAVRGVKAQRLCRRGHVRGARWCRELQVRALLHARAVGDFPAGALRGRG